jgi:hypothetical protein
LFDRHPAGVLADQFLEAGVVFVGDDDRGGVPAEAGDDELADGAGVAGQRDGLVLVDFWLVVRAGPVQRDRPEVGWGEGVDVASACAR